MFLEIVIFPGFLKSKNFIQSFIDFRSLLVNPSAMVRSAACFCVSFAISSNLYIFNVKGQ